MKKHLIFALFVFFTLLIVNPAYADSSVNNDMEVNASLANLDIFNKEKVAQVKDQLFVTSNQPFKKIVFEDGSSITMKLHRSITPDGNFLDSCDYIWGSRLIQIARYTIGAEWYPAGWDKVSLNDHWDTGAAMIGAKAYQSGTTAISTYGSYVRVGGTGGYDLELNRVRENFEFRGSTDGSCIMFIVD